MVQNKNIEKQILIGFKIILRNNFKNFKGQES